MTISIGQVGAATPTGNVNNTAVTTAAVTTAASGSGFVIETIAGIGSGNSLSWTLSDSFGNAYTRLSQLVDSQGVMAIDRWYIAPGAAGYVGGGAGHTATATPTSSSNVTFQMALIEMPGAATGNAAFYQATASHTYVFSSSPPYALTSLVVSPPAAGAILLSGLLLQNPASGTGVESTGFTVEVSGVNSQTSGAIGLKAVTSSATYTPSWSWSPTTGAVTAFSSIDSFFGGSAPIAPIQYSLESTDYF
jgi:hypothetical protein